MNKYHARKTTIDGQTFDSRREAQRWAELRLLERAGVITGLQTQVPFELIPSQKDGSGKVIERPLKYVADFVYRQDGKTVVEDAKGCRTEVYKIKRKLMRYVHGIEIKEV